MEKIKLGQIGIGHNHASEKMKAARRFPELFEIVGFAEDNEEWLKRRANKSVYEGLKRLSKEEIIEKSDAILVETDVWDLTDIALKCVKAGKHIHMDKPASGTKEEFKLLLDTAKDKNLVVQMGYMYRYNPAIKKCLQMIKEGKLGEIYSINAEMSTHHRAAFRKWLGNFGGGIQYILGSHLVDLIVYIMGKPNKITSFMKHSCKDGIDIPDNNLAVLEYDKALCRVFVSSVEVNGYGRRQFVVSGEKGTVDIRPMERPTTLLYSDAALEETAFGDFKEVIDFGDVSSGRYDEMMQDFYAYIVGKKQNPFTYEHDFAVREVLDEIIGGTKMLGKNLEEI